MMSRTIADEVRRRNLTYLGPEKSNSLFDCVEETLTTRTPGDFVEFGVALGGSGICLASFLDGDRYYVGFDVFSMIPPPSAADGEDVNARYKTIAAGKSAGIGGDQYYGYVENLYEVVKANFRSFGLSDQKNLVGQRPV
jgi:O-methyltransferase